METFLYVIAGLLVFAALVKLGKRYFTARRLVSELRRMQDDEPWRAAVETARRVKPFAVTQAQTKLDIINTRLHSGISFGMYHYLMEQYRLAEDVWKQAVVDDMWSKSAYQRVQSLCSSAFFEAHSHPFRAAKVHAQLVRRIEQVISEVSQRAVKELARAKRTKLEDVIASLLDGSFERRVRGFN